MKKRGVAKYLKLSILTVALLQSPIKLITERLDCDTQEVTRTLKKLAQDKKTIINKYTWMNTSYKKQASP